MSNFRIEILEKELLSERMSGSRITKIHFASLKLVKLRLDYLIVKDCHFYKQQRCSFNLSSRKTSLKRFEVRCVFVSLCAFFIFLQTAHPRSHLFVVISTGFKMRQLDC